MKKNANIIIFVGAIKENPELGFGLSASFPVITTTEAFACKLSISTSFLQLKKLVHQL